MARKQQNVVETDSQRERRVGNRNRPLELIVARPGGQDGAPQRRPIVLRVPSEYDPDTQVICCGQPAVQKQIRYRFTVNDETFSIPQVWAFVCERCKEAYFGLDVSSAISEKIFARQHPIESKLGDMLDR